MEDTGKDILKRAQELNRACQYEEAEKLYDALLTQNHDNPYLLAEIGTLFLHQNKGRTGLAIHLLEKACKTVRSADVACNLAIAYKMAGLHDKCDQWFKKSIEIEPTAQALGNMGALYVGVGNPDEAIRLARRGISLDPKDAICHWNLSQALLEKGEWETAWDEHEWGIQSKMRIDRKTHDVPWWDFTKDKTVVVSGEQGLGDEIMFASMLPEIIEDNTIIFECHRRLQHLFEHSFPGLTCIGTREDAQLTWPEDYEVDYRISIGSLGKFLRRTKESFPGTPYLKAESTPRGEKFRVGISWTGGLKAGRIAVRSVPLAWWKPILDVPDIEFISLQYTNDEADIERMNRSGYDIKVFKEIKEDDYYETAKLVKSCDLVISVCTSVVHLAGALGVPTWCFVPNRPAWRYGVSGRNPWYRSVRQYRQPPGDTGAWSPVIDRVSLDLSELIPAKRSIAA